MARIDDYRKAVQLAKKDLCGRNPKRVADQSGADLEMDSEGNTLLALEFLKKRVAVTWPECGFSFVGSKEEVPIQQQVLILHYLNGAMRSRVYGKWIAYQEVPDGKFYLDAFHRRARAPLIQAFGDQPDLLLKLATEAYGARAFDQGDVSFVIQAFPMVPVAVIMWRGDDEFSPEANILFDRGISDILSAEDIAWLSGMIIYPLIAMAKERGQ